MKTNYEKFRELYNKTFYSCEDCVWSGKVPIGINSRERHPASSLEDSIHDFSNNAVCKVCGLSVELIKEEEYNCQTNCLKCQGQGKGYVIPLEFGCEVMAKYIQNEKCIKKLKYLGRFEGDNCHNHEHLLLDENVEYVGATTEDTRHWEIVENLGKPLTLQDVLRLLNEVNDRKMGDRVYGCLGDDIGYYTLHIDDVFDNVAQIDLLKQPQDWSDKTWGKLLELVK